jgi:hypothetical protein
MKLFHMRQSLWDFSPVRIPRDPITFEHLQIKGLYPVAKVQVMPAELYLQLSTAKNAH